MIDYYKKEAEQQVPEYGGFYTGGGFKHQSHIGSTQGYGDDALMYGNELNDDNVMLHPVTQMRMTNNDAKEQEIDKQRRERITSKQKTEMDEPLDETDEEATEEEPLISHHAIAAIIDQFDKIIDIWAIDGAPEIFEEALKQCYVHLFFVNFVLNSL